MAENTRLQSIHLVEAACKIETDYFVNNNIDQQTLLSILKDINQSIECFHESFNPENDTKNMISFLLILERFKKNLVFESSVINIVESEFQSLFYNLDKVASSSNDPERSFENNEDLNCNESLNEKSFENKESEYFIRSKPRNKRANYPKKISRILKNWLKENMNNPYPSESEKLMLIEHTGLDSTQINNWFINARRRILPFMKSKYIKYD